MMESWLKRSISEAGASDSQGPLKKNAKIQSAVKYRQYKDSYALMGFTHTDSKPPKAVCFFCGDTLSNKSIKLFDSVSPQKKHTALGGLESVRVNPIDSLYYTQRGVGIKKNESPTT